MAYSELLLSSPIKGATAIVAIGLDPQPDVQQPQVFPSRCRSALLFCSVRDKAAIPDLEKKCRPSRSPEESDEKKHMFFN